MSRIYGKDTKPELLMRKGLHSLSFRYGLHRKDLPGRPDLVFLMAPSHIQRLGEHVVCRRATIPAYAGWTRLGRAVHDPLRGTDPRKAAAR